MTYRKKINVHIAADSQIDARSGGDTRLCCRAPVGRSREFPCRMVFPDRPAHPTQCLDRKVAHCWPCWQRSGWLAAEPKRSPSTRLLGHRCTLPQPPRYPAASVLRNVLIKAPLHRTMVFPDRPVRPGKVARRVSYFLPLALVLRPDSRNISKGRVRSPILRKCATSKAGASPSHAISRLALNRHTAHCGHYRYRRSTPAVSDPSRREGFCLFPT